MAAAVKHFRSRKTPKTYSENPLRALRQTYGISQALLARLLDVSIRSASALESGAIDSAPVRRNFTQVVRLCETLAETMRPMHVGAWLDEPNEMLAGLKPVEAVERGKIDLVWQVAQGIRTGSQL